MSNLKETKEVLDFVISLGNALGESLEDGEISYSDIMNFWEPISSIADAIEGASEIPSEIAELSQEELADLVEYSKNKFDIPQESVEEIIEDSLSIGLLIIALIGKLKK